MGRNGGVLTRPTVFPMANGMGLAGEAGDEAVVPLTHEDLGRDASGRMGVKNRGGGNVLPVMVTDKESLERLTSSDDFDEMMARMLQRPNSRARQALRM